MLILLRLTALVCLACFTAAPAAEELELRPNERILVIAPHPDDEVLACGGLIQKALALGDSVRVVYVTSGDGSRLSVAVLTGCLFPRGPDYVELGRTRMDEARRGARVLGLTDDDLVFLGYPDAELAQLWQENWTVPLVSAHTHTPFSPYSPAGRDYTGAKLLRDIESAIRTFRPARILGPHPCDAHPDHWSVAMFLEIARDEWQRCDTGVFPTVYSYLIHRPPYPKLFRDGDGELRPPDDLQGSDHRWFTLPLTDPLTPRLDSVVERKAAALECHESQLESGNENLYDYLTADELFDAIRTTAGPVTEDAPRSFFPWLGGEHTFDTVSVAPAGDSLRIRVALLSEPEPACDYTLFLYFLTETELGLSHACVTAELLPEGSQVVRGGLSFAQTDTWGWTFSLPKPSPRSRGTTVYTAEADYGILGIRTHSGIGRVSY